MSFGVKLKIFLSLLISLGMVFAFQQCGRESLRTDLPQVDSFDASSMKLREQHCAKCHQDPVMAEPRNILDDAYLIEKGWVVSENAEASPLYKALFANMPMNSARLSDSDIAIFAGWINNIGADKSSPAKITIDQDTKFDFGNVASGSTSEHSFTITNVGEQTAAGLMGTGLAAPFVFKGGTFPGDGGSCIDTLEKGRSCSIIVSFQPTAATSYEDVMEILYVSGISANAPAAVLKMPVKGTGSGPSTARLSFDFSPTWDFGYVAAGTQADKSFKLSNTGSANATGISFGSLSGMFSISSKTCSSNLAVGAACNVVVRFSPTANGLQTQMFTANYSTGVGTNSTSVTVKGTGAGANTIYFSGIKAILDSDMATCKSCHGTDWGSQAGGVTYIGLKAFTRSGTGPAINATTPAQSRFITRITTSSMGKSQMGLSPGFGVLSSGDREKIVGWIMAGSPNDPVSTPAVLNFDATATYVFSNTTTGQTLDHTFILKNSGGTEASSLAATAQSAPFSYKGGTYPGIDGTCSTYLAAGAECSLVIQFAPSAAVISNSTLKINYNDNVTAKSVQRGLSGTGLGISLAALTIIEAPTFTFPLTSVSTPSEKTLTVTNVGAASATSMASVSLTTPFSFKGGTYPGTGGTCGTSLAKSATCKVVLLYSPTTNSSHTASLKITYSNGSTNQSLILALAGTGIGAGVAVTYSEVNAILNASSAGTSSCVSCHSSDGINTYAGLKAFKKEGSTSAIIPSSTASRFIARISGASVGKPQMGTAGYGTLSVNDQNKLITWILAGALDDPPKPKALLKVNGGVTYDFGSANTGVTKAHTFTMRNMSAEGASSATAITPVALTAPFKYKGGTYPGTGGTCSSTISLAPQDICTLIVEFTPTSAAISNLSLKLNYNDGTTTASVLQAMKGTGLGASLAALTISDTPTYDFGLSTVGVAKVKVFTLTNTGAAGAAGLAGVALTAPYQYKGGTFPGQGTCTATLAKDASCTIQVIYTPTTAAVHSANLRVNYNNGSASTFVSVGLTGTGVGGGTLIYYSSVREILSLPSTNCNSCHGLGNTPNWGETYVTLKAFKRESTTPAINPSNPSSRFILRITQATTGKPQMGTGSYGSLTTAQRNTIINWIVQGALDDPNLNPATLTINRGPTYSFGNVNTGQTPEVSFTVQNTGDKPATSLTATALAAPFSFKGGSFAASGTCTGTLAPNATCTVAVRFAPTTAATAAATLKLNYNNGTAAVSSSRPMTGTGVGAPLANLSLNSTNIDFGSVPLMPASTLNKTITVTNIGTATAKGISITALVAPFKFVGGTYPGTGGNCGVSLAATGNCKIVVGFVPTANGTNTANMILNYNNGASSQTTVATMSGTGAGGGEPIYFSEVRTILTNSCSTCHNSNWGTTYAGLMNFKNDPAFTTPAIVAGSLNSRFAQRLQGIPTTKERMGAGTKGNISPADLQTVLDWISQGAKDDPHGSITQDFTALLGDRYYLGAVLTKVYGDSDAANNLIRPLVVRSDLYGSPCFIQDLIYKNGVNGTRLKNLTFSYDYCTSYVTESARIDADMTKGTGTVAEGLRQKACVQLSANDSVMVAALPRAGLDIEDPFTAENVSKAYGQFYAGATPSTQIKNDLMLIGQTALTSSQITVTTVRRKKFEGWRFIFMTLCLSPEWQAP